MKTKLGVCGLMSLGLIATVVAVVRASSLGTKTADLSYDVSAVLHDIHVTRPLTLYSIVSLLFGPTPSFTLESSRRILLSAE